jgi:site-specific recombinase XerD
MPAFCLASRSNNTVRQYKYAINSFCKWCLSLNITQTLTSLVIYAPMYLIHLTNIGKSVSTINEAYYNISWPHRLAGVKDPCKSDLVITVKEGAHRSIGHLTVKNEPITPEILNTLVCVYADEHANRKHIRIACMCLLSYAGFLRYSELSNLRRNHDTFYEQHIKLFFKM